MEQWEEKVRERSEQNGYMKLSGIDVVEVEQDRVVLRMPVCDEICNPYGVIHGGALYTLADDATGEAAHTDGRNYVTQVGTMQFLRNIREGAAVAEARVRHRGRSTCLVAVDITAEGTGALLATGEYTYFRIDPEKL